MIDVENIVVDKISKAVKLNFKDAYVSGEYIETPKSFPFVSISEVDNYIYKRSQTLDKIENHALVSFECNVYSNKTNGKKKEAKQIAAVVDEVMASIGFTRTFRNQVPNIDRTVYRILMRWTGVVSQPIETEEGTYFNVYWR